MEHNWLPIESAIRHGFPIHYEVNGDYVTPSFIGWYSTKRMFVCSRVLSIGERRWGSKARLFIRFDFPCGPKVYRVHGKKSLMLENGAPITGIPDSILETIVVSNPTLWFAYGDDCSPKGIGRKRLCGFPCWSLNGNSQKNPLTYKALHLNEAPTRDYDLEREAIAVGFSTEGL